MGVKDNNDTSPMMGHYLNMKENYKDCFLFYRLGDFYELFFEDAVEASKLLELTLTRKSCGGGKFAPMCGVPFHAADIYISKLVHAGKKVAICEQLTTPEKGKIVDRDVVRIVTPGTITEDTFLQSEENNYIAFIYFSSSSNNKIGVSYCDITTGEFYAVELKGEKTKKELNDLICRINPSEILVNEKGVLKAQEISSLTQSSLPQFEAYPEWVFDFEQARAFLQKQFGINCLIRFEMVDFVESICSSGALIYYLNQTQKTALKHINKISNIRSEDYVILDNSTRRNLELVETIKDRRKKGSLLSLIDQTKTSMGARLIREWINQPLRDDRAINRRLEAVDEILRNNFLRERIISSLSDISDIQRIVSKIAYMSITPKECLTLHSSLVYIPEVKSTLANVKSNYLTYIRENIADFSDVTHLIASAIDENCTSNYRDGGYIKKGFNDELDRLRDIEKNGISWTIDLEKKYREETGIKNLKISFNRVFGYYIEVPTAQNEAVPLGWRRKQTISNNERYINNELKDIEEEILHAKENALELESKLYDDLKKSLSNVIEYLQALGKIIAELDCLTSFATVSVNNFYNKPRVSSKIKQLRIIEGRHPVVERINKNHDFISNDTLLDNEENNIAIITGPNMAGKSTYMRQVAVIALLAHIGCFVPAKTAEIPVLDRIFTRVGASDDLSFGQSTFMVEMSEVSTILDNATSNSLVVLDEIGRGTSTFDGLSIAWSVVEYIAKHIKCLTLFSTHYHELGELEGKLQGVKNYKITVKEFNGQIIFLRKIVRGSANRSFGVEVASLAGLPQEVIDRAKNISNSLEKANLNLHIDSNDTSESESDMINRKYQALKQILQTIEVDQMTPLASFDILIQLLNVLKDK